MAQSDTIRAEVYFNNALDIYNKLLKDTSEQHLYNIVIIKNSLAKLYALKQDYAAAGSMYKEAINILKRLTLRDPQRYNPSLGMLLNNLGSFYSDVYMYKESEEYYLQSLEIRKWLANINPKAYNQAVAQTYYNLANLYQSMGDAKMIAAEDAYLECIRIYRDYVIESPRYFSQKLSDAMTNLGALYEPMGYYDKMENLFKDVVEIKFKEYESNPSSEILLQSYSTALDNLVWAQLLNCNFADSEINASQSLNLMPIDCLKKLNLANTLFFQGNINEATKIYKSIENEKTEQGDLVIDVILSDCPYLEERGLNFLNEMSITSLFIRNR